MGTGRGDALAGAQNGRGRPAAGKNERYERVRAARRRVVGGWTSSRTKCSSPRSSSSHWTVSPPSSPMAAAKAKGASIINIYMLLCFDNFTLAWHQWLRSRRNWIEFGHT